MSSAVRIVIIVCVCVAALAWLYMFIFMRPQENTIQVVVPPETLEEKLQVLDALKSTTGASVETTLSEAEKQQVLLQMREAAATQEKVPVSEKQPAAQNAPEDRANAQQKLDVLNSLRSQ